jgi:hypothetical protein
MKYIQRCKRAVAKFQRKNCHGPCDRSFLDFELDSGVNIHRRFHGSERDLRDRTQLKLKSSGKFCDRRTATQDRMLKPLLTKTSGSSAFSRFCRFGPNAEREGELQGFPVPENGQMHHSPRFQTADHAGYVARGFDIIFVNRQNHILLF